MGTLRGCLSHSALSEKVKWRHCRIFLLYRCKIKIFFLHGLIFSLLFGCICVKIGFTAVHPPFPAVPRIRILLPVSFATFAVSETAQPVPPCSGWECKDRPDFLIT